MDKLTLEKYSSAFTLSDMEVFLFPELLYALVLANIMSPQIWRWREDPWFADIEKQNWNRRLQRLRQYIMDHYSFNLDLETWGLTTKPRELARFSGLLDTDILSRSNALFGYEGDKYYFDIDIRRHFGLDQYTTDIIPYWKTETVEAMDAFVHKPGHAQGAGECVSLAALWAAALYIVLRVPLENIFLMATPLHSQNFILQDQGVLTNNRRLVTKNMWFNGSVLSEKARRALEKEQVTIVSHLSGYIHVEYPDATLDRQQYARFNEALSQFLTTTVNFELFANFLRVHGEYRKYFQFEYDHESHRYYLTAEKLYQYEHNSRHRVGDASRLKLAAEVETDEYDLQPDPERYTLNALEPKLNNQRLECHVENTYQQFREMLDRIPEIDEFCQQLKHFACTQPRLPSADKTYLTPASGRLEIPVGWSREEICTYLEAQRGNQQTANLAFYAGRQLDEAGWAPFLKACFERNPVSLLAFSQQSAENVFESLQALADESIYSENRLATPDEVVNFKRGDGLEKALCLANVLKNQPEPPARLELRVVPNQVELQADDRVYTFQTQKAFEITLLI